MAATREREALLSWALAALKGAATHKALRQKLDKRPSELAQRFGLEALERRTVELAWAVERSLAVAEAARARGGLTVERLRALLGDAVDAALSPRRALRRHALVQLGHGTLPAATDVVRLAPGLAARLDGAADPEGLWMGVTRVLPGGRGDVPGRVAGLLAGLDGSAPALLTLDGCPRRDSHELALGLARQLGRGVLLVDGELMAAAPDAMLLMACARREADCEGDALLVCEAAALGERWRALLAPATASAPPLIVLTDGGRTRDPLAPAPFVVRRLSLHAPVVAGAPSAPTADAPPDATAPVDDGLDQVRKLAIRDAERALGIFRPPPVPPRAQLTPAATSTSRSVAATAAEPPSPAGTHAALSAPTPAAPPPPTATPTPVPSSSSPPKKRSSKGAQYFGGEEAGASAPSRQGASPRDIAAPASVAPAVAATAAAATAAAATVAAAPPPDEGRGVSETDGVPLALADNAPLDELARVATTSPSAAQRIALITRLRSVKSAVVVAALRANAANAHPGVRAAAEAAMSSLFGSNWSVARPVPKPVQPPRSDDKDRGPPGG